MGRKQLEGSRFGKLVVLSFVGSRTRPHGTRRFTHWLCRCDCGTEKVLIGQDLLQGRTKSCGCGRKRFANNAERQCYQTYRSRAKQQDRAFTLTLEEFVALTTQACHYCGGAPRNVARYRHDGSVFVYSGLDRKDNERGYAPENCVPCCEMCNKAKRDVPYKQFVAWLNQAAQHTTFGLLVPNEPISQP